MASKSTPIAPNTVAKPVDPLAGFDEQRLRARFAALDVNHDGKISKDELKQVIKDLKLPFSKGDAGRILKQMDQDGNGAIDYEEFKKFVVERRTELRRVFDEVDSDKSGTLSIDEVADAMTRAGLSYDERSLTSLMRRIDTDHSGNIDFEEWCELLSLAPDASAAAVFRYWADAAATGLDDVILPTEPTVTWVDTMKHMFAGAVAGTISRTLTAPLERLKIMYQINHEKPPGFIAVLRNIYKEGGFKAFFRGNGANVMKVAPEMAIKMYTFDKIKAMFAEDDSDVTPWQRFLAGGIAGQVCHASVYPLDVLKIRLAATAKGTYNGIFDAVGKIYAAQGFSAFYRGLTPVLLSTFPHNGINLTCYETIKHEMIKRKYFSEQPGPLELLFCTTIAGTVSQFPTYPVHVIVSRLASQGTPGIPREYASFFDAFKKITAKEGARGLYKGILPSLMKSLPSSGISLVVYEYLKRYAGLQKKKHGH